MYRKIIALFLGTITALAIASSGTASAGLVGWWPLDGDAKDTSGTGNDGILVGNPTFGPGMVGQALVMNGTSQNTEVADNPSFHNFSDQLTVTAWINPLALGDSSYYRTIVAKFGPSDRKDLYLYLFVNLGAALAGPRGTDWTPNIPIEIGAWAHVALTYDGSTMVLYKNGVAMATLGVTGNLMLPDASSNGRFFIGYNTSWIEYFSGQMDDVRLYNKALTEQQIQDVIAKGTNPTWDKAEKPNPADGTVGVAMPLLQWGKGESATLHNLYLGTSPNLTDADLKLANSPMAMYYHVPGLQPGTTYYWRVDEIEKDGVTIHTGDVWSFVAQALTAYYPTPVDGGNTASISPTLTWMAGAGAIEHHVYFGDSNDAVSQAAATVDKGTVEETTFSPGALDSLKTYYWRVDEILTGNAVKAGPVWKFTTPKPVDDFESYTDDEGGRIYETWIDGWTNNTGSTVGNAEAPFAEQTVVHGGLQSMPLDYNNASTPFYSEAEQDFGSAQDWTTGGVDTLVLYVCGRLINGAAPLYVALEDASKHIAVVVHPDPTVVTAAKWIEWKIPLNTFTGVNLGKIQKMYIGVGDRTSPAKGGTGRIYIDDIGLLKP
jgi:hypothetical protein